MGKAFQVAAAINVGSNYLQMVIGEIAAGGHISILEDVFQPTDIGRDTFAGGRIERETVQETCDTLRGFAQLMKDYGVKTYRAVATSGMREAENREYVLERIRLKTKIDVEVINTAQERFFMYKALRNYLPEPVLTFPEASLVVNIATGGVETSIYKKGTLKLTEYIKIGSLRLRETLADLEGKTFDFPGVIEKYIDSKLYLLNSVIRNENPANFIVLGSEARTVADICSRDNVIEADKLIELSAKLHKMSDEQIARNYRLTPNQAATFLPTVILLHSFLKMTNAGRIFVPAISLKHGLLCDINDLLFETPHKQESLDDVISSVWYIANKFGADKKHAQQVERLALSIFDQTWKLHRLRQKERLYLQVAAILHAIGYYVGFTDHHLHAYKIIQTQNIMGFSDRELNLIANIVRYHMQESPSHFHPNFMALSVSEKMVVSQLAAILKLAECLDVSHVNNVEEVEVAMAGEQLHFYLQARQDTLMEEWYFRNNVGLLEEVTGLEVVIKRRS